LEVGVAVNVDDDVAPCLVGTAEWVDELLAEQLAEATESGADYRDDMEDDDEQDLAGLDDLDDDVAGDGPRDDDEPDTKPVVFAPLPPNAGVAPGIPRGCRAWQALQPAPEVDESGHCPSTIGLRCCPMSTATTGRSSSRCMRS